MQHYLIAKYVDDIRRNEPINVGVVVFGGGGVAARFEGEDDEGRLDKRRIRRRVSGRDAYGAWVQHWRRLVETGDERALLQASSKDFYLEPGGTIVLDLDERGVDDAAGELYSRLVKPEDPPAPVSLQEKSRRSLRLAGADLDDENRFQTDPVIELEVGGQTFRETVSYGVSNGAWHYLQEVSFDPQRPRRSRKEANHAAFVMEHALIDGERIVLYDSADIDETTAPLLDLVTAIVPAIDVSDAGAGAAALQTRLHLTNGASAN